MATGTRCGPYSIRLTSDAFASNLQGRNGALRTFARGAVFLDNRLIYPTDAIYGVRIGACPRDVDACDGGWAARVTFASARLVLGPS